MKKLIYLFLTVLIVACVDDEGNPCVYSPTLTTSAVANVTETSATLNGVISIVSDNCDNPTNTEQGFVYATTIQPTINNIQVNVNGTDITTTLENLEPNTTYYARTFLTNALGEFYGNEVNFITSEEPVTCDIVYLADNGITIKACEGANVGDIGTINGVDYTVVDEAMLREMVANEEDVTKVATTRVIDMSELFFINQGTVNDFNQDISSWDVSNVTNMYQMLREADAFNQDIGDWDVSNVTNMYQMFYTGQFVKDFNQDISSWDVSNVTDMSFMFRGCSEFNQPLGSWNVISVTAMRSMFSHTAINQDISSWDVSSVTDMGFMFFNVTNFNQAIGDWNVSNVTDMGGMFFNAQSFNQPIGDWDLSNVTYMGSMFCYAQSFNQPIGDWNVSNVTDMGGMFRGAPFNQDISSWDVSNVDGMSQMFRGATYYNQDLSSWNVDNVTSCPSFSDNTPQWTLPQPNFTNCTP